MMKDMLLRQVHPVHFKNGLSSGAFRPTPSDQDKLSVDCGNLTDPEAAFELHKKKTKVSVSGDLANLETAGTWAFTREICVSEKLEVTINPIKDEPNQPDNPAHHLVDFSTILGKPNKKNDTAAKRLRSKAVEIGRLWPKE